MLGEDAVILYIIRYHVINMYGIMEVQVHALLSLTLDAGDWLVSGPVCFTPRYPGWA